MYNTGNYIRFLPFYLPFSVLHMDWEDNSEPEVDAGLTGKVEVGGIMEDVVEVEIYWVRVSEAGGKVTKMDGVRIRGAEGDVNIGSVGL